MKKVVLLVVLSYGLDFLLNCSFADAQARDNIGSRVEASCSDLENPVDWKEKHAEDYARPTQVSDLRRFVLDDPRLINKCGENVIILATYKLDRNKELFEAALALETDLEFESYIAAYIEKKGEPLLYDVRIAFSQGLMMDHFTQKEGAPLKWSVGIDCDMITRNIYVDRKYWESLEGKDKFKEALIYHELGHCDLNREHVGHFSFMNDGIITAMEYGIEIESQSFYDDVYTELFSSFADRKETHQEEHRKFDINSLMALSVSLNRTGLGMDEPGLIKAGLTDWNR